MKNTVAVTLRLTPDERDHLRSAADDRGVSGSWLAAQLVREGLRDLIPPDDIHYTKDFG